MEPTEPLPQIRCALGKPSVCVFVCVFFPACPPYLLTVPGRAWRRVQVCETGGPRGAGGKRRCQEHGRVSWGPGHRGSLLTEVGGAAPGWETRVQKAVSSPASSCPSLGLSVTIYQKGKQSLSCQRRGSWVGLSSVVWVQEGNQRRRKDWRARSR